MATASTIFRGFSSSQWAKTRSFTVTGIELVKRDLLNHIFTLKGERVMIPDFGTRIPIMAFEPNDEVTMSIIETDLTTVFNYDPRVNLISLNMMSLPNNNAIIAQSLLYYIQFGVQDILNIEVPTQ